MALYILQGAEDTCSQEGVHLNPTPLGKPLHSYTNPLEHYTFSVLPHSPHTASRTPQHPAQHQWDSEMHGPEQQHNNLSSIFSLLTTTQPQTSSVSLLLLLFVEDYSTYVHWLIFREASMCVFMHVCVHACVCVCACMCMCVEKLLCVCVQVSTYALLNTTHYRNVAELLHLSVTNYVVKWRIELVTKLLTCQPLCTLRVLLRKSPTKDFLENVEAVGTY